jgi:hypothetical protein
LTNFRLWAVVNKVSDHEFAVTVSAVDDAGGVRPGDVELKVATSFEVAETMRAAMLLTLGRRLVARGDKVVDVEE